MMEMRFLMMDAMDANFNVNQNVKYVKKENVSNVKRVLNYKIQFVLILVDYRHLIQSNNVMMEIFKHLMDVSIVNINVMKIV